ncbi:class I SAM-dependent methyltransferase [Legionella taurinensis]|uniref:methyltransferase n=1 Tax=Legionella taurinensis TaxID=70611 RepID=UPI001FD62ADA|nr:methyltransferase [Legionella taurinensis]MDX1836331.1 methyltransferase [Legionella taurinensis]
MTGLVFAAITSLLALGWPAFKQRRRLRRWRQTLALHHHAKRFTALYQDVDGFALSRLSRTHQDAMEYVYGEIEFEPFIALLSLCHITPHTVFYDLGSGCGKAIVACAMVYSPGRSCGIELFAPLHQAADELRIRLQAWPEYALKAKRIEFRQADFLEADLRDADLIFINSTAFFGDYWRRISGHLEQLKPGTQVISTSKPLDSAAFYVLKTTVLQMSWGRVTAYLQHRLHTK